MKLKDKVVVITGGSRGFGKALAKMFASEGAHVVISDNDADSLETASKELFLDKFVSDVAVAVDLEKLGEYAFKKYGAIDIWINNAGVQIAPSPVESVDIQKLKRLFDVNFFGYFYGCQTALFYMKKQGNGVIINVNSTAGLEGKSEISAYSSSKFAVKGLTESIRKEIKDSDIKVYAVFPGGMKTEIYKEKYPDDLSTYMDVEPVVKKVIDNLKSKKPKEDLIIKRK